MSSGLFRWARVAALAGLVFTISLVGCNPFALFLIPAHVAGWGDKANIKWHFPDDAKRVAIVVHMPNHNQLEVGHFDRDINTALSRKVADYVKKRPEIILAGKVNKWLDEHQEWKTPYDIGRGLKADHVVFIEVRRVTFYDREGWTHMYKGTAEMSIGLYRVGNDVDEAQPINGPETVTLRYPNTNRPVFATEITQVQFREAFVRHVAERLSWYFVPHASNLEYGDENSN